MYVLRINTIELDLGVWKWETDTLEIIFTT
jgi:hypothetical protein